jgi:hypothetical protein
MGARELAGRIKRLPNEGEGWTVGEIASALDVGDDDVVLALEELADEEAAPIGVVEPHRGRMR